MFSGEGPVQSGQTVATPCFRMPSVRNRCESIRREGPRTPPGVRRSPNCRPPRSTDAARARLSRTAGLRGVVENSVSRSRQMCCRFLRHRPNHDPPRIHRRDRRRRRPRQRHDQPAARRRRWTRRERVQSNRFCAIGWPPSKMDSLRAGKTRPAMSPLRRRAVAEPLRKTRGARRGGESARPDGTHRGRWRSRIGYARRAED